MLKYFLFTTLLLGLKGHAQYTLIPDPAFEIELISRGIDTDGVVNGQVLTSDIADETILSLHMTGITDLTGLEDFISLDYLSIFEMNITQINLTNNSELRSLLLQRVNLENLDLSFNIALVTLYLSPNCVSCGYISTFDILDLSENTGLETVGITDNYVTHLDFSANTALSIVELNDMENLVTINLKNGANENIDFLRIERNDNINCIQVDDPEAVIAGIDPPYNNWIIDGNPIITDDCELGVTAFIESQITVFPNPVIDVIRIRSSERVHIEGAKIYDISGRLVFLQKDLMDEITIAHLRSGLYLLRLSTNKGSFTQKLLKR